MLAPELSAATVRPVLQDWALPPIDLWAMFPTGRRASGKARAFASFIEAQLSKTPRCSEAALIRDNDARQSQLQQAS
jgi:hypothetical protein